MERVEREYFPEGKLKKEVHFKGKKEHGPYRIWHANGVLAEELWFENGIYANGTNRTWFANGQIRSEITFVNADEVGRMTVWDEDGGIVYRHYVVDGKKVSLAKYEEASKSRSDLPRYEPELAQSHRRSGSSVKRKTTKSANRIVDSNSDSTVVESFLKTKCREARQWLEEAIDSVSRDLGELDYESSRRLVAALYQRGALQVLAVQLENVLGSSDEATNHLLVELPADPKLRHDLFAFENEHAESAGFDGESDRGQRYLYFKL